METETQNETEKAEAREYGFTIMVEKTGNIKLTPHNLVNDFEFVGLVEYVNQKKSDLLKTIGLSIEARALHAVGVIAKALSNSSQESSKAEEQAG